jgi:hypothetical protein
VSAVVWLVPLSLLWAAVAGGILAWRLSAVTSGVRREMAGWGGLQPALVVVEPDRRPAAPRSVINLR